ncbi:MAG: FecR domain-containing protein [Myxococcales bacterium]|nr:FecR domain-containing protein [Myxococcales bacterium]
MWIADDRRTARPEPPAPPRRPLAGLVALERARGDTPRRRTRHSTAPMLAAAIVSALAITITTAPAPAHAERAAAVEVAMVTDLAGRVERQPQALQKWAAVALDEGVALFDALRTWERSTAELRFVDGTVVMLDEKTRLRISPVLFDPAQAPEEVRLALAEGAAEIRAGKTRLWVETPDGARHPVDPGEALRISVGEDPRAPRVGPPTQPLPVDLEADPPTRDRPAPGGAFDPTTGRVDPSAPVEGVVEALPGAVEIDPGAEAGAVIRLPPLDDLPGVPEVPEMPERPDNPGLPGIPDRLPGGDVVGDLLADGVLPVLDLPELPTDGRVRVSVEVRRR